MNNERPDTFMGVNDAYNELVEKYKNNPNVFVGTEMQVVTPNGEKGSHFLDVGARDTKTGALIEGIQIGRQTKGEDPVARERRAIQDIKEVAPGAEITFRPYN
jgi:hypothetical protein